MNKKILSFSIGIFFLLESIYFFPQKNKYLFQYCQKREDTYYLVLTQFLEQKQKLVNTSYYDLDVKNKIKRVLIVAPNIVTGGPENLCQMYAEFKRLGFETYILWIGDLSKVSKKYKNRKWYLCKDLENTVNLAYVEQYKVTSLSIDIPLDSQTLVIIPEVWTDLIYFFDGAKKAIAWLSIINFDACGYADIFKKFINKKDLGSCGCIHMTQAPWIEKTLKSWGADSVLIGDYISKKYFTSPIINKKILNSIAFFPRKGGELAEKFIKTCSHINFIRLENFNQDEMINALDSAQIYIDFGHFPGKDRVPREALARDCIIFIHNKNCATDYDSFPIDDYFRFTEEDVLNGNLLKKIQHALLNYEAIKLEQSFMKQQILEEEKLFQKRIKNFIGLPLK